MSEMLPFVRKDESESCQFAHSSHGFDVSCDRARSRGGLLTGEASPERWFWIERRLLRRGGLFLWRRRGRGTLALWFLPAGTQKKGETKGE